MSQHQPLEPIPRWKIVVGVVVVGVLTAAAVVVLWWAGTSGLRGKDLVAERMDALKVGLSIGVGSGGLFALYLGWRRQRSTEADLDNRERALQHQQQVAAATQARQELVDADARLDARERRITELYTKAADQLGSDKAAVRLAGLYALERLAQDNEPQRQTIVNVLCAYLRMPYTPPDEPPADEAIDRERAQEREVRLAAQRILRLHLQGPESAASWRDIDIDLTGAVLIDFSFARCHLRTAAFNRARFHGLANFARMRVSGNLRFNEAWFHDDARFTMAGIGGVARFNRANFQGGTWFRNAWFGGVARFNGAEFHDDASFDSVRFEDGANFSGARFRGGGWFGVAEFGNETWFSLAEFGGDGDFRQAEFRDVVHFTNALLPAMVRTDDSTASPWVDFAGTRFARGVPPEVAGLLD